jgi:GT2 family glycosyltransferase
MGYAIADVELTRPLGTVALRSDQDGLALLVRLHGRPVHFALYPLPAGTRLDGDGLWRLCGHLVAKEVVAQRVRGELLAAAGLDPAPRSDVAITVAVCTRDRAALLGDCLDSLLAVPGAAELDVLVVDNDPPDDATRDVVTAHPGVRRVVERRPGLDFARNRALAEARGKVVAFLDDDVIVDRGWLGGLREALGEHPGAGIVTGLVLPFELETAAQVAFERRGGFRRGVRKLHWCGDSEPGNPFYPVGAGIFGAGANMVVRRDLVRALGGFDEALDTGPPLPGGGDLDIFQRVARSGAPIVYEPSLLVFHRHRAGHDQLRRQYWSWGEGFAAYLAKTYAADPAQREKLRGMTAWWLGYAGRRAIKALARRGDATPDLALAELAGGLAGLAGGYGRSRRRVARIEDGR